MVQGAVYDAVNAIAGGYRPYLPTARADRRYSQDAAAATAAFKVVSVLVPSQLSVLQGQYDASLALWDQVRDAARLHQDPQPRAWSLCGRAECARTA